MADELKDEVRLERPPAMEGRALSMVLIPALGTTKERGMDGTPNDNKQEQVEVLADAQT